MASPFLKWAGGKAKLVPAVLDLAPDRPLRYHEPFLGGGAIFFALEATGRVASGSLNDFNAELIQTYTVVRDAVDGLIGELEPLGVKYLALGHEDRHECYYEIRASRPQTPVARAARLIFLNRTCFNGLYRVNRRGDFNVPHGDYVNPRILDRECLQACSEALRGMELTSVDFEKASAKAEPGDLVYFDPPYQPLSRTSNFTSYTSSDFAETEQRRLAEVFRGLTNRGVFVILSNSAHPFVEGLYKGFEVVRVPMPRAINSAGARRGPIDELLITNFGYLRSSPK